MELSFILSSLVFLGAAFFIFFSFARHVNNVKKMFGARESVSLIPGWDLSKITSDVVAQGTVNDARYKAYRVSMKNLPIPTSLNVPRVLQLRLTYKDNFPGRLTVQHTKGLSIQKQPNLESIEFNKETIVFADSSKVAFAIFSPDFMEWYLTHPAHALLIFQDNTCLATILETTPWDKQRVEDFIAELTKHIRHSGALAAA